MPKETMRHIPALKAEAVKFEDVPSVRLQILLHFREAYTSMFIRKIVASPFIDFIEVEIPNMWSSFF